MRKFNIFQIVKPHRNTHIYTQIISNKQSFNCFSLISFFNFNINRKNVRKILPYLLILFLIFSHTDSIFVFASNLNINQNYGTARNLSSMPTKRTKLGVVEVGGKIYCIGGYDGNAYSSKVEVYDIKVGKWSEKTSMPTARQDLGVAAYGSKIYCMGGYNGSYLAKVEVYDVLTDTWETKTNMTSARANFGITQLNGIIYCVGGYNGSSYLNSMHAYDIKNNSWSTKTSTGYSLDGSVLVSNNNNLYLIGGHDYSYSGCRASVSRSSSPCRAASDSYYSVVREYNVSSNSWTSKTSMPTKRANFGAVVIDDKIYCMGGYDGSAKNVVEVYDTSKNNWSTATTLNSSIYDFGAVAFAGEIYSVGGYTSSSVSSNMSTYKAKDVTEEELATIYVSIAEEFNLADDMNYARELINSLPDSQSKDNLNNRLSVAICENGLIPEDSTSNIDIFISSENMLALSLSTASITFEDFDGISNIEKANAITMTVSSSLPYNINSYLVGNIVSSSGNTMDKSILNIKTNGTTEYKAFINNTTPIELVNNATQGNSKTHNIDLMLKGNIAHTADVYKATIKLEVVQG